MGAGQTIINAGKSGIRTAFAIAATAVTSPVQFLEATFCVGMTEAAGIATAACVIGAISSPTFQFGFAAMAICFAMYTGMNASLTGDSLFYSGLRSRYDGFLEQPEEMLHDLPFLRRVFLPGLTLR